VNTKAGSPPKAAPNTPPPKEARSVAKFTFVTSSQNIVQNRKETTTKLYPETSPPKIIALVSYFIFSILSSKIGIVDVILKTQWLKPAGLSH
jgi:hypothetical protein